MCIRDSLSDVLTDAIGIMEPRLSKSGAKLTRAPKTSEPIWVTGGYVRLQQVFVNLIGNALDAMEHVGAPEISILREDPSDEIVRILVHDIGEGLSDDAAERAFDPFFTTKTTGKGLGLGLSISYNIVVDFGGHLSARNNADGPGASFTIELKRTDSPDQASLAAE